MTDNTKKEPAVTDSQGESTTTIAPLQNLAKALVKAQVELKNPEKNQQGHGYRYADLANILDQTKAVLAKHGLAVSQLAINDGNGRVGVKTILLHESGEMLDSNLTLPIPEMLTRDGKKMITDTQAAGAAITYARRYALSAILNIAADEDTDATGVSSSPKRTKTNTNAVTTTCSSCHAPAGKPHATGCPNA